jgi:glycosyltransferase involved in cell wall biosynthesis
MSRPTLSLVLPVFNEEEVLPILHSRLQEFLTRVAVDAEVIFVNDGSTDRSMTLLRDLVARDARYKVVSFSRNFGHGNAITAGVDYARGHAVVIMDADLQDPPEVIIKMLERWREGYDVVYAQRLKREGETAFKLFTARWFYRLLRALVPINVPLDTGDFRLMSRQVVVTLRALRETHRFVRGIVAWIGFRQIAVHYDRPSRAAGETKYPLSKMLRLALDAITSFSVVPLRFSTYLGMFISVGSVLVAFWALLEKYAFNSVVPGWTATVVLVSLLSSVQLLMIGILGEYVGRVYEQVKGRPLYLVGETLNMPRHVDSDELEPVPATAMPAAPALPVFPHMSPPPPAPGAIPQSAPPPPLGHLSAPPPALFGPPFVPAAPTQPAYAPSPALPPPPPLTPAHAPPPVHAPSPASVPPHSAAPRSNAPPPPSSGKPRSMPPPVPPTKPRSAMKNTLIGVSAPVESGPPRSKNPMKGTLIGVASSPRAPHDPDDDTRPEPLPVPPSREGES